MRFYEGEGIDPEVVSDAVIVCDDLIKGSWEISGQTEFDMFALAVHSPADDSVEEARLTQTTSARVSQGSCSVWEIAVGNVFARVEAFRRTLDAPESLTDLGGMGSIYLTLNSIANETTEQPSISRTYRLMSRGQEMPMIPVSRGVDQSNFDHQLKELGVPVDGTETPYNLLITELENLEPLAQHSRLEYLIFNSENFGRIRMRVYKDTFRHEGHTRSDQRLELRGFGLVFDAVLLQAENPQPDDLQLLAYSDIELANRWHRPPSREFSHDQLRIVQHCGTSLLNHFRTTVGLPDKIFRTTPD